jgi:hypothetical protein
VTQLPHQIFLLLFKKKKIKKKKKVSEKEKIKNQN